MREEASVRVGLDDVSVVYHVNLLQKPIGWFATLHFLLQRAPLFRSLILDTLFIFVQILALKQIEQFIRNFLLEVFQPVSLH